MLMGTWREVGCNENGKALYSSLGTLLSFDGNRFIVQGVSGETLLEGHYVVDPTRNPKSIDWTDTTGIDAGKTFLAIYTLSDNCFTFCAADQHMERPTGFDAINGHTIRVFRRVGS